MRVFAYGQMSENAYGLPGSRQFIVAREGSKHFIPDSADIDSGLRRQGADEFAVEKRDHRFVTKGEALKRGSVVCHSNPAVAGEESLIISGGRLPQADCQRCFAPLNMT